MQPSADPRLPAIPGRIGLAAKPSEGQGRPAEARPGRRRGSRPSQALKGCSGGSACISAIVSGSTARVSPIQT